MQKQVRIAAASLVLLIVIAVLLVAWSGGLAGLVAGLKDKEADVGLSLSAPAEAFTEEATTLSASAEKQLVSVAFQAKRGDCTETIGETEEPYTMTWTPSTCGEGSYVVQAIARHANGKTQTVEKTVLVTRRLVDTVIFSDTIRGGPVSSSSTAYPPNTGSASSQRLATISFGPATTEGEYYIVTGSITMRKASGGTFDGSYRVIDATSGAVLVENTLSNPVSATEDTFSAMEQLAPGANANVQLQFRSKQEFSAVSVDSFTLSVEHIGLR